MKKTILIALLMITIILSLFIIVYFKYPREVPVPKPLLQNEIGHIDNSLEYLRAKGLGIHDMAEYVISKSFLGTQIPNKQQIIDYFDNNQRADGSWKDAWTPMFTTHRVLLAYYLLNATPKRSLDTFFNNYDTWTEAKDYIINETKSDYRDIYHITLGWGLYHVLSGWGSSYPPWLDTYFSEVEKEPYLTSWTTGTDAHRRTHILYNYVIARRQFPNLDGIIDETLREQSPDGHWDNPRQVYWNGIQLALLQQIIKLYPGYRTIEIQNSINKSRQWVYNSYNTQVIGDKTYGRFGSATYIEDALMTGIMAAGINGLMNINVDMTFEDLVRQLSSTRYAVIEDFDGSRLEIETINDETWSQLVQMHQNGNRRFVGGIVEKYDNKWGFGFKPETIIVADVTAEGLQATIKYISDNLNDWLGGYAYVSSKVVEIHSPT